MKQPHHSARLAGQVILLALNGERRRSEFTEALESAGAETVVTCDLDHMRRSFRRFQFSAVVYVGWPADTAMPVEPLGRLVFRVSADIAAVDLIEALNQALRTSN